MQMIYFSVAPGGRRLVLSGAHHGLLVLSNRNIGHFNDLAFSCRSVVVVVVVVFFFFFHLDLYFI